MISENEAGNGGYGKGRIRQKRGVSQDTKETFQVLKTHSCTKRHQSLIVMQSHIHASHFDIIEQDALLRNYAMNVYTLHAGMLDILSS